jgi:drug/metabolite transporter (DMT)-like permease
MNETKKGFIQLHLSVLLAGFTGIFGRLITLNEVDIVWYRMLFTSLILLVFTGLPRVGRRKLLQLCACGALLGFHWILFYGSIKASNVSIGVVCFSLIGFFTAVFEPLLSKKRISWLELFFSLITVAGVLCIFSLDARYRFGIMLGIVSSAAYALYAICNKKTSRGTRSRTVLMYQMSGGLVAVTAMIPAYLWLFPSQQPIINPFVTLDSTNAIPDAANLGLMLGHALFCTVAMYLLQIQALKRLSAFTVNLTYNLEPCYAIILAFLIFGEGREINFSFYIGVALILLSVLLQSLKAWKDEE